MGEDHLAVADRLFGALEAGDIAAVEDLYGPDTVVWLNIDGVTQSRDDNLRVLGWMLANVTDLRYEEVRRSATAEGFVQQHVLRAITRRGRPVEVPACMVVTMRDGRIARIDEYLDSAHLGWVTET